MRMNAEELKPNCQRYMNHILFQLFSWFYCQLMQCLWSEVFVKMHIALQRIWPLVNWMNVKWRYNVFLKKEKEKQFAQFLLCWIVFKHYPYIEVFPNRSFFPQGWRWHANGFIQHWLWGEHWARSSPLSTSWGRVAALPPPSRRLMPISPPSLSVISY